jgi:hypothetical protein
MTSKDPEIQEIYDQIKEFKTTHPNKCSCQKKCDHCRDSIEASLENSTLPTIQELELLTRRLTGVEYGFNSRPMKWDEPFILTPSTKPLNYSDWIYHIIFIEYGIVLFITIDMIRKIPILNSILLKGNGCDSPIRLKYMDVKLNKVFKGPHLYITKLEPCSLVFGKPPSDYQMNIDRKSNNEVINFHEKWFKHDNVGESLMVRNWYT